jgi:hypothetical protein
MSWQQEIERCNRAEIQLRWVMRIALVCIGVFFTVVCIVLWHDVKYSF